MRPSFGFLRAARKPLCAAAAGIALAMLAACATQQAAPPPPPPTAQVLPPPPVAGNPTNAERPEFMRLPGMAAGATPVRVGILLPLNHPNAATRALANAMLKAAQLALFDGRNRDILLMPADEGNTPAEAASAATRLLNQGAEIIVGPLFSASVTAVAPLARDRAVPVVAFSSDRSVAGQGTYLLSFLPENEVRRVVQYARAHGRQSFAGFVPQTAYGDLTLDAYRKAVADAGGTVGDIARFAANSSTVIDPASAIAKTDADTLFIPQGGVVLHAIAPTLGFAGLNRARTKLLGTGLWYDNSLPREPMLTGGWFAAPSPNASDAFDAKYRAAFGAAPPALASLAYDALSLVALLSQGTPYQRFTPQALTDPNGFSGVDGIFRFVPDGTSERGLAVLEVTPEGFTVADPAPTTFQHQGS